MRDSDTTLPWKLYEQGRTFNSRLIPNQYSLVETNTEFFIGNQWLNLPDTPAMRGLPKPTFNILKRISSLFVASLTTPGLSIQFRPRPCAAGTDTGPEFHHALGAANAALRSLLERFQFEHLLRDALFDGAQTGDYAAHFWFDPEAMPADGTLSGNFPRGEIQMELVDGINVLFGNPNDRRVEVQPYILLVGRDTVRNLREEQARWRPRRTKDTDEDTERIQADRDSAGFANMGLELDGTENEKALYVLLYTKVEQDVESVLPDGRRELRREISVHVTKATRNAVIYEDIDTGLSRYPIAWGNWEKQKHLYHGRALVTGLIPNQIFINTMFATAMRHLQLTAFPKMVYNADLISAWTNEAGQAVGIHGLPPGQSVLSVAAPLQTAEMSGQIFTMIDKAMTYTKECLGATDVQLGSAKPDNTSALILLRENAEIPLENIRAGLYEWAENAALILLDMISVCYGRRRILLEQRTAEFDFSALRRLRDAFYADVGPAESPETIPAD